MTISAGVSVTAPSLLPAYPGTAYTSAAFAAAGGSGTGYTWSWAAAGGSSLPSGLSIDSSTGVISGTPVNSGSSNAVSSVVVTATDSLGNKGSATVTITIEAAVSITTSSPLPGGTKSVAYDQMLAASGGSGTGYKWTTDSAGTTSLASVNLTLSLAGSVSGTPVATGTATFTATATDSEGHTASATFSVTIYNALTITTTSLPSVNVGASYSQTLNAGGGTGTGYTWTATNSNLSTFGLSFGTDGSITGTPTQTGDASFTANVKDSGNNTATQVETIHIYSALSLPTPNPSSLPSGYKNVAYSGSVTGSGGSGSLSIAVTTALSPSNGTLATGTSGATVNVTGTPSTATTESFGVTLTDTTTTNTISQTYTITVNTPTPVSLPSPTPGSLPAATVSQSYTGSISASGGVSPYMWSVNGTSVPSNGTHVVISNGIYVTNDGSGVLSVGGTPTSTTTVNLTNVKVTDAATSNATQSYSITVNSAGQNVSGQIVLTTSCGGSSVPPAITVKIANSGNTFTQTTTTDNSGNFSFSNVPNDTYTITPSISGASSVFTPGTQSVTVNNADATGKNFNVMLGYTVSGTVSYSGSHTGQIYLVLNDSCGNNPLGTSITSAGTYTIRGVPPGSYSLQAFMDTQGFGASNANDPSGSTSGVTVSNANATGVDIALSDASAVTLSSGPTIQGVSAEDKAAVIPYKPILDSNGVEQATSYTVEWSTDSGFSAIAGSKTFTASGDGTDVWIVSGLTNSQPYYFRARGSAGSSNSSWTVYGGGTPTAVTIGAPSIGNTVTGTVTFTGTATGPLYVGFFDQSTGSAYVDVISSPVSPQAYTVKVPNGSSYVFFGIIDQNSDGIVGPGDITNVKSGNNSTVAISGNTTQDLTLPSAYSTATVTTQYWKQVQSGTTSTGYNVNFNIREGIKLPVAVELTSGPNVVNPIDVGKCTDCSNSQFQYYVGLNGGATPTVGDSYTFHVTYSDGTSEDLTSQVSGVLTSSALVTNMAPTTGSSTSLTPTFTWTYPTNASSYTYEFWINKNGSCSGNCTIWQIPGQNSNSSGFTSADIPGASITWGTDPTDGSNTPSAGTLTNGVDYSWSILTQDSNGNQAQSQVDYQP